MGSATALAASQRGHVFSFGFGSFSSLGGIAVDSATGDVYVVSHKQVDKFEPDIEGGELVGEKSLAALAVSSSGPIAVDDCRSASQTCTKAQDPSVGDLYVVESGKTIDKIGPNGETIATIKEFEAGETKRKLASIDGVAVDAYGELFVHQAGGQIFKFNDAAVNEGVSQVAPILSPGQLGSAGFAVDAEGEDFYVGALGDAPAESLQQALLHELEVQYAEVAELDGESTPFTVAAKLGGGGSNILIPALDYERASALAVNEVEEPNNQVDERNDVYVLNVAGAGSEKTSTVAELGPEEGEHGEQQQRETGALIQRFGAAGLEGEAIAVDPKTGIVYVADSGSERVDVFELEAVGPPAVEALSAKRSAGDTETIGASVNPRGAATNYYFEYGLGRCTTPGACTRTSVSASGEGFGGQDESFALPGLSAGLYYYRAVAENAHGKAQTEEGTFTVLAELGVLPDGRAWEMVSPPDKAGAEPEAIRREGGLVEASTSGDAITYVADGPIPANEAPAGNRNPEPAQILSNRDLAPGQEGWSSHNITTPVETGAGFEPSERWEYQLFSPTLALALVNPFIGSRGPYGSPPLSPLLPGEEAGKQENTPYLRADEDRTPAGAELADYVKAQEDGREMEPENAGYLPLVTQINAPGPDFGREFGGAKGIVFDGATPDLTHVVYRSENSNKHLGLYEWSEGQEQLVNVLENGEEPELNYLEAYLGGSGGASGAEHEPANVRHAISENGSRVFWTYVEGGNPDAKHLEVRETDETAVPQTLQLDMVRGGTGVGFAKATYQTASADGSKVFFTDTQRLTADSGATAQEPDLYVAELEIVGGKLTIAQVKDLTPVGGEGAGILLTHENGGGVIGASEDGSYVYFVANGALAPGASRGYCTPAVVGASPPAGTTCNLYVRHYNTQAGVWEPTRLIAVLSADDSGDWGDRFEGDFGYVTGRVSPNGEYLAFMSDRSLTGYDNEDVSGKGRRDEEVYLYKASSEELICASCNPSGERPVGVFDAGGNKGGKNEGLGLVVDRPEIWASTQTEASHDDWLAGSIPGWTTGALIYAPYQSRYLSNSGRLIFNSADPLLPAGSVPDEKRTRLETVEGLTQEVGVENVYEYEPAEVGGCHQSGGCIGLISSGKSEHESAFLDASETGNDVFFLTAQQLAPQDIDGNFDVYDAHLCEAASPCTQPSSSPAAPCEGEPCQGQVGAYTPPPLAPQSGTAAFSGPGNAVSNAGMPKQGVLGEKKVVPVKKPLTRAQKLTKALKACHKDKHKSRRLTCEKQARHKYGPHKKTASKSSSGGTGR